MSEPCRVSWVVMGVWLWAGGVALACEGAPTHLDELGDAMAATVLAWEALDAIGVGAASHRAEDVLGCLDESITTIEVAEFFRTSGYAAFLASDFDVARDAFESATALQPSYQVPTRIAGENHPMRMLYEQAKERGSPNTEGLDRPAEGWLTVDGIRANEAPSGRPWVFQRFAADGSVVASALVEHGAVPDYPVWVAPVVAESTTVEADRAPLSRPLLIASAATGVAAGIAMGVAGKLRADYRRAPAGEGELQGTIGANRGLGYSGIGLGVVAGGLGVSAVVVGRW
jgi:hypothetical protein